jgi:hypothetical protein
MTEWTEKNHNRTLLGTLDFRQPTPKYEGETATNKEMVSNLSCHRGKDVNVGLLGTKEFRAEDGDSMFLQNDGIHIQAAPPPPSQYQLLCPKTGSTLCHSRVPPKPHTCYFLQPIAIQDGCTTYQCPKTMYGNRS